MPFIDASTPRLPFQSHSDTSREAAIAARSFAGHQSLTIRAWFRSQGRTGGTQREASDQLGIGRPSICARTRELETAGVLVKTASRRAGCAVYQLVEGL